MKIIKSHQSKLLRKENIQETNKKNFYENISVFDFIKSRNKILVYRRHGGFGDLINTRMLFKTIKFLYPNLHVTYAIPKQFWGMMEDHPYIDAIEDCETVNLHDYGYVVDISSDCGKYESTKMPYVDKHRSDIWAEISLGISLIDHNLDLRLDDKITLKMKEKLKQVYDERIKICIFPRSASPSKDIPNENIQKLIDIMTEKGLRPCIIDNGPRIKNVNGTFITDLTVKELLHITPLFDYAISVDTGAFHLLSGLTVPTVGIFTWTDGITLSKYHPKCIVVQKHRCFSNGMKCCPCWNWPVCQYKRPDEFGIPLRCMKELSPELIFNKLEELIDKYPYEN